MKRLLNILILFCFSVTAFAQEDTYIVDSLRNVLTMQEGREKVLTMIELTWEFYDISYDDCLDWGEKAIKESQNQSLYDLEAKANYVLGIQYAYHGDLDLAKEYLQKAYTEFTTLGDEKNAFESLWNIATYELTLGSIDTAFKVYDEALLLAKQMGDTLAWADILSNIGVIWYNRREIETAYNCYIEAKNLFGKIGAKQRSTNMDYNLAAINNEKGLWEKARRTYWSIIPEFEKLNDEYYMFLSCKDMGRLYENGLVNFDSAMYYYQKAMDITEKPMSIKEYEVFINNEKSGVLVEMANIMVRQGEYSQAIAKYKEALQMAEECSYYLGQMEACVGLIKVYSIMGQAEKSEQYHKWFSELEKRTGIDLMRPSLTRYLILNYARLHQYDALDAVLESFEEDYTALLRENADVYEQNRNLNHNAEELLQQYESQNQQIQTLQTQRNRYRLAFFGLLLIVLTALILIATYKIVLKNKSKSQNT